MTFFGVVLWQVFRPQWHVVDMACASSDLEQHHAGVHQFVDGAWLQIAYGHACRMARLLRVLLILDQVRRGDVLEQLGFAKELNSLHAVAVLVLV